ncbi:MULTISPECIES: hypothetical protein [unclassified Spirillospora]|uniref:hypothetical protein n=1 Tax=unclassified Spirillospora TaxID=2642701 RepID=UPI003711D89C
MTNVPPGDPSPWHLRLGFELEEVYSGYSEIQEDNLYLFSGREALLIRDRSDWAVDRLNDINIDPSLIDIFEDALEGIPTQENQPKVDASRSSDLIMGWILSRTRTRRRLEHLMQAARIAVGPPGVRYYDCGVMLCRLHVCDVMAPTPMTLNHRNEVRRAAQVLEQFITHTDVHRPRAPEHRPLDRHFETLADHLKAWRTSDTDPDRSFFQQIRKVIHLAGITPIR